MTEGKNIIQYSVCDDCYPNFIEEYKKDEWLEEKVEIKE